MKTSILLLLIIPFFCSHAREDAGNGASSKKIKTRSIVDINKLTPFDNIAVIQKRYLPKTYRGELNVSLASIVDNHFFYLFGFSGHVGMFVRENHGFGIEAHTMYNQHKLVARDLIEDQRILPYSTISSKNYVGAYYKWSPIFGKFAVMNNTITYFDMFFTIGVGAMKVEAGIKEELRNIIKASPKEKNPLKLPEPLKTWPLPAISLGVGQVFALNKSFAVSWDIKTKMYFYKLKDTSAKLQTTPLQTLFQSDIIMSLGLNYYFPGATYR